MNRGGTTEQQGMDKGGTRAGQKKKKKTSTLTKLSYSLGAPRKMKEERRGTREGQGRDEGKDKKKNNTPTKLSLADSQFPKHTASVLQEK
jgi:hypothetical protein